MLQDFCGMEKKSSGILAETKTLDCNAATA